MLDKPLFTATILSLLPEAFPGILGMSLAGKALQSNIWAYNIIDIRDFGRTKHRNVDDEPYGGGNGLVMRADILSEALDHAIAISGTKDIYYLSPRGKTLKQEIVSNLVFKKNIILLCGRFEGIDERIITSYNVTEISIGDFVLSGGELAAQVMLDACIRLLPGVLANPDTLTEESFSSSGDFAGLLEYPLYTRPPEWRGHKVPDILLSGNHAAIKDWRLKQARELTATRRPDLLTKLPKND